MKDVYHYDESTRTPRSMASSPIRLDRASCMSTTRPFARCSTASVCRFGCREHLSGFIRDCRDLDVYGLCGNFRIANPHAQPLQVGQGGGWDWSVNTVSIHDNDRRSGTTRTTGRRSPGWAGGWVKSVNPLGGKRALVLGAGSMARAIVFGLRQMNIDVVIASRTLDARLAEATDSRAVEWESRYAVKTDILINCTPVGMHPNVDESPFPTGQLRRNWIVFDVVYNPEQTLLVKEGDSRAARRHGVDLFTRQAALQFKVFTKQTPPLEHMRLALKRAIGAAKLVTRPGTDAATADWNLIVQHTNLSKSAWHCFLPGRRWAGN